MKRNSAKNYLSTVYLAPMAKSDTNYQVKMTPISSNGELIHSAAATRVCKKKNKRPFFMMFDEALDIIESLNKTSLRVLFRFIKMSNKFGIVYFNGGRKECLDAIGVKYQQEASKAIKGLIDKELISKGDKPFEYVLNYRFIGKCNAKELFDYASTL